MSRGLCQAFVSLFILMQRTVFHCHLHGRGLEQMPHPVLHPVPWKIVAFSQNSAEDWKCFALFLSHYMVVTS